MGSRKKIMVVFGTRPEAIKMAPVIRALKSDGAARHDIRICVTAQHRQMLDQVLKFFKIRPDIDLNLMKNDQTLSGLTSNAINELSRVYSVEKPSMVLVQGDTTTAFVGALAAFYHHIPVGHVEAGLRTDDLFAPFPEEANRRLIGVVASHHFAPTERAARALLDEGVPSGSISTTGNTVIDALFHGLNLIADSKGLQAELCDWFCDTVPGGKRVLGEKARLILITGHRRESFGEGFLNICGAIRDLAKRFANDVFVYPVHLNPNVRKPAGNVLRGVPNVALIEPIEYPRMLFLMSRSHLVLTDSGGIQEESPSLRLPVVIMREKTERPELVEMRGGILVGNERGRIVEAASLLLEDKAHYRSMQMDRNPYGDGKAGERIADILGGLLR